MENTIFNIFAFCMFIVFGVLILGLLKGVIKYVKLCYRHVLWRVKILMILPLSIALVIIWQIIEYSFEKGRPELLIAIILGCIGSHYIFKDEGNI